VFAVVAGIPDPSPGRASTVMDTVNQKLAGPYGPGVGLYQRSERLRDPGHGPAQHQGHRGGGAARVIIEDGQEVWDGSAPARRGERDNRRAIRLLPRHNPYPHLAMGSNAAGSGAPDVAEATFSQSCEKSPIRRS
jgi:hypothetical protein